MLDVSGMQVFCLQGSAYSYGLKTLTIGRYWHENWRKRIQVVLRYVNLMSERGISDDEAAGGIAFWWSFGRT